MSNENREMKVKQLAFACGFDCVGIAKSEALPVRNKQRLTEFIAAGEYGTMDWLAKNQAKRMAPNLLMAQGKSLIMVGMNYAPAHSPNNNPLSWLEAKGQGVVAAYALGRDYHDVMKKKLKIFARKLHDEYGNADLRLFVDTAPLAEKPFAMLAGIGWQGKHSNLVSKEYGSWLFLGAVLTALALDIDQPAPDACGTCQSCIDICPTRAITAPYQLDARKCIAYLTIEHQGVIPLKYRQAIGNRIFGCDDCLAVCPWNKFAKQSRHSEFAVRESLQNRSLAEFLLWGEGKFRANFSKSPLKRLGFARFIRNVLIAAGNSGELALIPQIQKWQDYGKNTNDEVIIETASWALTRLQGTKLRKIETK